MILKNLLLKKKLSAGEQRKIKGGHFWQDKIKTKGEGGGGGGIFFMGKICFESY